MIIITESPSIKSVGKTSLKISFDYNQKVIDAIKSVGDAVWDAKRKTWELPNNKLSSVIESLTYLDDIELNLLEEDVQNELKLTLNHKYEPFDYQKDGISWMINSNNGLLLDCPGLGKSLQTIYAAEELKAQKNIEHCLIICGINTLKQNWKKEIEKFSTLSCVIIGEKINSKGKVSYASVKERAEQLYNKIDEFFVILNIESLRDNQVLDAILNSKNTFDLLVTDECHKFKNPSAGQTKNFLKLAKYGKYHFGLTGTALVNSPLDAYVPLKFIGEEKGNYTNFKNFYCNFSKQFGHLTITSYKNMDILKDQISSCSLRRSKDILDLPPKVIIPEYLEMDPKHESFYNALNKGIVEEADRVNIRSTSLLGLVVRLRQATSCPELLTSLDFPNCKLDRACDLVDEITSNGEKVVIFSYFKEPLYKLHERLKEYNPLLCTGDQQDSEVSNNIDKFQNDPKYKVLLATTSKMGTGVTLTAASYEIFVESDWTPALECQSEDRCHRIGSTKTVIIYKLICKGTIDERVQKILEKKRALSDYVIDDKVSSNDELRELLGIC